MNIGNSANSISTGAECVIALFKEKKHALGGGSGGGHGGGGASGVFPIVVSVVIIESERGSDVVR
jgi:hypothetical protein